MYVQQTALCNPIYIGRYPVYNKALRHNTHIARQSDVATARQLKKSERKQDFLGGAIHTYRL